MQKVRKDVRDVTFENISIVDSKLTEESKRVRIGEYTENIRFDSEVQWVSVGPLLVLNKHLIRRWLSLWAIDFRGGIALIIAKKGI